MSWAHVDAQMFGLSDKLSSEVGLPIELHGKLATAIAAEVRFLRGDAKREILSASPVSVKARLTELSAFQGWMDHAGKTAASPFVVRAQVMTQNYVCFVYLPESCFRVLAKHMPAGSATKKCAQFLCNDRVRSFRNALAHANWTYRDDFQALIYWARKGSTNLEPLTKFEVDNRELNFWQALSRCVAYAALSNLN